MKMLALYAPVMHRSRARERQGRGGLEGIRTMRDDSTSYPCRRRFACRVWLITELDLCTGLD